MRFDGAAVFLPLSLFNIADPFLNAYRVFNSASLPFKSTTASLAWPIFCCTMPSFFSAFPSAFKLRSFVTFPTPSLIVPATSWKLPLILSFVLVFIFLLFSFCPRKARISVLGLSLVYPGHDDSTSAQLGSGLFPAQRPQFDELAFWFLICRSFTTCFTFGTAEAICSACARLDCELTSPVSVTTPFLTSYLTLL